MGSSAVLNQPEKVCGNDQLTVYPAKYMATKHFTESECKKYKPIKQNNHTFI